MSEDIRDLTGKKFDDKDMEEVTGGKKKKHGGGNRVCSNCRTDTNNYPTGRTETFLFGLLTRAEYHCGNCGHNFWNVEK